MDLLVRRGDAFAAAVDIENVAVADPDHATQIRYALAALAALTLAESRDL